VRLKEVRDLKGKSIRTVGSKRTVRFRVNGESLSLAVDDWKTLLEVLRDDLGLTGAKYACGTGECGACTVLMDGKPILSCLTLAVRVEGKEILSIEGLAKDGVLHPIQQAFLEHGAVQCGFCTPGLVLTAKSLLDRNPAPTEKQIREYIKGNLCRCTGYAKVVEAISACADMSKKP